MQLRVSPQNLTAAQEILKMHNQGEYEPLLNEILSLKIHAANSTSFNGKSDDTKKKKKV
jgi:hypothetical protein